jgi:CRP/FNR family transcriptional regulator, cyclic AMP receptor protein
MKKILLIEDNPDVRQNTAEILHLASFQVLQAENGKVGVELAKEHLPDLIICDIMMPELDGFGVLYMLGKDSKTASIPFIFLTAKTEKSDIRKGMTMGADDYLTKPFDEMELLDTIESRLKRADLFRTKFANSSDNVVKFLDEAKGINALEQLSENRRSRVFPKKTMIFFEGDYPNSLYFLNSGKIKTFKMNEDGKEFITGLFKPGEFIGYTAILENANYPDSGMVMEESEILTIPRMDFLALLNKNRDVANRFIKMLTSEIVEKENQLLNLAYNTVRKRVAQALVQLFKRYSDREGGKEFSMAISRDDLASMVGTTTESVIRTLSDFKEEGMIEIQGRNITLRDVQVLDNLKF